MTATATAFATVPDVEKTDVRKLTKAQLKREVEAMSHAMVEQGGLLNHPQAAILLDVSSRRVSELVELGKLTRFDFLGRTYVSMREVRNRLDQDLKAGRPARNIAQRLVTGVKMALKSDAGQVTHGGYTEYAGQQKLKKLAKRKK
ncbi:MAG: hypothetical protein ABJF10_11045 [Chthoniobacter sp.]|uniref:hypothetical protein n=1 Tax=Chthoniobacter sp. TaxID=2510640 RepID=UPI0032AC44CD